MSLKAKVEAVIYAAEEPITLEQISVLLRDAVLAELASAREKLAVVRSGAAGDEGCESTDMPELACSTEELSELEPGPLMPQACGLEVVRSEVAQSEVAQSEELQPGAAFGEDDEPFFALQAEAAPVAGTDAEGREAIHELAAAAEAAPQELAKVAGPEATARKRQPKKSEQEIAEDKAVRARLREILAELVADYASEERGMEIRQIAGGFRMTTKPQHHDVVRAFAKSLKPPIRLSLAALETLAVIAYKQPVTAPEIAEIRGVESASVLGTLLDRKLITTAGRKHVIGRPMQYKTSKDFLLRFGLNDVNELPSMEEFSQLASDATIEIAGVEIASEVAVSDAPQTTSLFEPGLEAALEASPNSAGLNSAVQASAAQPGTEDEPGEPTEAEPIGE